VRAARGSITFFQLCQFREAMQVQGTGAILALEASF
jgi:hypothetical protein